MWVYTGDDIGPRLGLVDGEAFWLDYWLFLHAEETHSVWGCRPIGLGSIARIVAEGLHPIVDQKLIQAIGKELESYHRLGSYLDVLPPASPAVESYGVTTGRQKKRWRLAENWLQWLKHFEDTDAVARLVTKLSDDLKERIQEANLGAVAFLARRLSSELADSFSSPRELLQRAKQLFLHDSTSSLADRLACLISPPANRDFIVTFRVGPVSIPSRFASIQCGRRPSTRLVLDPCEPAHGCASSGRTLVAIESRIASSHAEQAVTEALADCRDVLHQLRVQHYVRTHLLGPVRVQGPEDLDVLLSLAQPFWTKKSGRREVPHLPSNYHAHLRSLKEEMLPQWTAMRWHVSQAIGYWAEDVHSATSEIWQAIESFAGGLDIVQKEFVGEYLALLPRDLLEYLATRVSYQAFVYYNATGCCCWYFRDHQKTDLDKWLGRILHPNSSNHHSNWSDPVAPSLLFDPTLGLITTMNSHKKGFHNAAWLSQRTRLDLAHLYAVRNAVVHKGVRVGTERWAGYLARVGLESLLAVVGARAKTISRGTEDR